MKLFRLIVHQKGFSGMLAKTKHNLIINLFTIQEEDLLVNPKGFPEAKEGSIVEIYRQQPEEENPRLLLQIKSFKEDLQISKFFFPI